MKLVSVIVLVCKIENYIAQIVNSVINQTYPYFELLIIDDESPDCSI